jgi:hypothetical protein
MSRTTLVLFTGAAALLIAACSSAPAPAPTPTAKPPGAAAPTVSSAIPPSAAPAGLSGTWAGKYSGAFNGTFTLNWQQSASNLSGTIKLSTPPSTLPINGTVTGNTISFGTLGSTAISYSGTVSGNSMSGTYKVQGGNASTGGPWSASKTS